METRSTVDALGQKGHEMKERAEETLGQVAEVAHDTAAQMTAGLRQNPLPYALIGAGVAWLILANRRAARETWDGEMAWDLGDAERDAYDGDSDIEGGDRTAAARRRLADVSQRTAERARYVAQRARTGWGHLVHENPMAVGLAAVAVGAIIGAMIPASRIEREYLGEVRDTLLDSARGMTAEAVDEVVQTARSMASDAVDKAVDKVADKAAETLGRSPGSDESSTGASKGSGRART